MNQGDPGLDTWPSLEAARHGGAQAWLGGATIPRRTCTSSERATRRPPTPSAAARATTSSPGRLIAVNVDTGKMAWYYQTAPHDMHDWDSAQTPVLVDAPFNGRTRKLVMTAARNGYFFVLDRVTGEHLLTSRYGSATNWVKDIDAKGRPRRKPEKDASVGGALVSPSAGGTINWEPPAFNPATGLFYVSENNTFSIFYLTRHRPARLDGAGRHEESRADRRQLPDRDRLQDGQGGMAAQVRRGRRRRRRRAATAGKLVFAGDGGGNIVAHDATTGMPLWHSRIGDVTNPPQTYLIDGRQYLLVAAGDTLFAFVMY